VLREFLRAIGRVPTYNRAGAAFEPQQRCALRSANRGRRRRACGMAHPVGWAVMKIHWHAQSNLELGMDSSTRAVGRLRDGSASMVIKAFASQIHLQAGFAALVIAAGLGAALRVARAADWFPAGGGSLYLVGMFLIYLSTPYNLEWHVTFSVDRILLTVAVALFAIAFLLLDVVSPGPARVLRWHDGGAGAYGSAKTNP
jgi:hypothetical protein